MHTRFTCGGCLALLLLVAPLAVAQDSERNRFFVQQMIELAADGNAQGVDTMQRMLEQNPKPAATDADLSACGATDKSHGEPVPVCRAKTSPAVSGRRATTQSHHSQIPFQTRPRPTLPGRHAPSRSHRAWIASVSTRWRALLLIQEPDGFAGPRPYRLGTPLIVPIPGTEPHHLL